MKAIGKSIAVEGINFAGKTTQVTLLSQILKKSGYPVCVFRFPNYETQVGKLLHRILYRNPTIPSHAIFALFSTNRLELKDAIETALTSGKVVLFDRYSESEYAYGGAKGLPRPWLLALESQMPVADLVLLLDIEPLVALQRAKTRRGLDIFEQNTQLLSKVRQHYLELASRPPHTDQQWKVIDAAQTIEAVHKTIKRIALEFMRK